jgi:hypothetical protein
MNHRGNAVARKTFPLHACERCGAPGVHRHHKDDNPENNEPSNVVILCFACHMYTRAPHFTETQVIDIRYTVAYELATQAQLADEHNVSRQTINEIVLGKTWRNVGGPMRPAHHVADDVYRLVIATQRAHPEWSRRAVARYCNVSQSVAQRALR